MASDEKRGISPWEAGCKLTTSCRVVSGHLAKVGMVLHCNAGVSFLCAIRAQS
jgi:hypothetical protein